MSNDTMIQRQSDIRFNSEDSALQHFEDRGWEFQRYSTDDRIVLVHPLTKRIAKLSRSEPELVIASLWALI